MIVGWVLALTTSAAAISACPEQAPRIEAIAAAIERRPTEATLHYFQATAWAACGQVAPTLAALERTRQLGSGFLPVRAVGFDRIWDDPEFRREYVAFERALPRSVDAEIAYRVRGADLIPEGIAFDERESALYIGSMMRGEILRVRKTGQEVFADRSDGLMQVLGLAIDAARRRLYAVNTNGVWATAGTTVRNELVVFDLDTGAPLQRFEASGAGQLNDVAWSANGTLYASDSLKGAVYIARSTPEPVIELFVPEGSLPGANGLAVAADGTLFVAHSTGIARVDAQRAVTPRIANETRETIAAIDGLYLHEGRLIGIQNATNPGRVVEITLDAARAAAIEVRTLLSHHHPMLDEPTTGAIAGDRFLVLANSYIGTVDDKGRIKDASVLRDPVILAIEPAKLPAAR